MNHIQLAKNLVAIGVGAAMKSIFTIKHPIKSYAFIEELADNLTIQIKQAQEDCAKAGYRSSIWIFMATNMCKMHKECIEPLKQTLEWCHMCSTENEARCRFKAGRNKRNKEEINKQFTNKKIRTI